MLEGAVNNLPDLSAEQAARKILDLCRRAVESEIVMVLISGGGSALLPCPIEGVELKEKRKVHTHTHTRTHTHTQTDT